MARPLGLDRNRAGGRARSHRRTARCWGAGHARGELRVTGRRSCGSRRATDFGTGRRIAPHGRGHRGVARRVSRPWTRTVGRRGGRAPTIACSAVLRDCAALAPGPTVISDAAPPPVSYPEFCRARVRWRRRQAVSGRLHGSWQEHGGRAMGRATGVAWRTSTSESRPASGDRLRPSSRSRARYPCQLERQALSELIADRHTIVATGGGTFAEADNRALDAGRRRRGVARSAARARHRPGATRRTPPAGRRSRAAGAVAYATPAGACPRPPASTPLAPSPKWLNTSGLDRASMRYLILSDIHANLEALESTLSAAGQYGAGARRSGRLRRRPERSH